MNNTTCISYLKLRFLNFLNYLNSPKSTHRSMIFFTSDTIDSKYFLTYHTDQKYGQV